MQYTEHEIQETGNKTSDPTQRHETHEQRNITDWATANFLTCETTPAQHNQSSEHKIIVTIKIIVRNLNSSLEMKYHCYEKLSVGVRVIVMIYVR